MTGLAAGELERLLAEASATSDSESVTRALSRDVRLPVSGATAVLITLDNGQDHTKPNVLGPRSLASLNAAIDAAVTRPDISAIALTGKPFILAAGADLTFVSRITTHDQAEAIAQIGHAVFDRLHTSPVPTFALINGLALGGGLEVALHCHYRTVASSVAGIALPECLLGMLPGWGGAFLLPNLIGADRAVSVIVENALSQNQMLTGPQAHAIGIADAMFDSADFLECSLAWADRVVSGQVAVDRAPVDRGQAWDDAVARGRAFADEKLAGAAPAPYRALELVDAARHGDRLQGYAAEDQALADLLMTDEMRASLYAFELVQKRARRPAGAPERGVARPVSKVGVVGAGLMATQLGLLMVRRLEVPVVISDVDEERVHRGVEGIRSEVRRLVEKGRATPDQANRWSALVSGTTSQQNFAGCDLVIEAVFEELAVKQQVFADLEQHVGPSCILATNTSALSVSAMASVLQHPERVVGLHFFNPVAVLPLVEVVRGSATDEATLATALAVAKQLRKNAVLVQDSPGFVVNRLLTKLMGEVTRAVDEGTPVDVADSALRPLGLPLSPFTLLQLVGPAVALHVAETLHDAFGSRFPVSENLRALVAANRPGIYDWSGDGRPYVSEDTRSLLVVGNRPSTSEQVRLRAVTALAEEVGLMLTEGVVAAPMDIDLCMILGAGWPFHLGGIVPYLDREGVSEQVTGRCFLPSGVASLP